MGAMTTAPSTVRGRAAAENFPVALRLLPGRRHLLAVYDVARTIDEAGDDPARSAQQRSADLDAFELQLRRLWAGAEVSEPSVAGLRRTVAERRLSLEPFLALVAANRLDQTTRRWTSWADLRAYCALSADPVGTIVLEVFGAYTPARQSLSDDVCTALQLLEHCQDVGEDYRLRDRVYLPLDELTRCGVDLDDLA